jgi:hypothetical protein
MPDRPAGTEKVADGDIAAARAVLQSTGPTVMAQTNDDNSSDFSIALAKLSLLVIVAAMTLVGMLRLVDHFRPRVGDIITFDPGKIASSDMETRIDVMRDGIPSAIACLLDVRVMRMSGGSFIIEATRSDQRFAYRVHWAGGPTGDGLTNCGVSADLYLSQEELGVLKGAASH